MRVSHSALAIRVGRRDFVTRPSPAAEAWSRMVMQPEPRLGVSWNGNSKANAVLSSWLLTDVVLATLFFPKDGEELPERFPNSDAVGYVGAGSSAVTATPDLDALSTPLPLPLTVIAKALCSGAPLSPVASLQGSRISARCWRSAHSPHPPSHRCGTGTGNGIVRVVQSLIIRTLKYYSAAASRPMTKITAAAEIGHCVPIHRFRLVA